MQELGDQIAQALGRVGITEERISTWLGKPCGCARRRRKLNKLSKWARETIEETLEDPLREIRRLIGERPPRPGRDH